MTAAVVVAHPDDETLWAGGTILAHPEWRWYIVTLCRAHDPDRAPKFFRALKRLGATGRMADLDDGPEQTPLPHHEVEETVLSLLDLNRFEGVRHKSGFCRFLTGNGIGSSATPASESPIPRCRGGHCGLPREGTRPSPTTGSDMKTHKYVADPRFDVILTHGLHGEYTRHLRHEEVGKAVAALWQEGSVRAQSLHMFAYEDGGKQYLPRAAEGAHLRTALSDELWRDKYRIITEIYGFGPESFEAQTTPREEAFWCFDTPQAFHDWVEQEGGGDGEGASSV